MSREYARLLPAIWSNPDFKTLTPMAQHLYLYLFSQPDVSYAGVTDWRPKRIARHAAGWNTDDVEAAGQELADALFIIIDDDTEEALIRTFHRNDGCLRIPNMAAAVTKAYLSVASDQIKGVIIHELRRLHTDQPGLAGWKNIGSFLDDYPAVDPATLQPEPAGAPF